jgi:hypothetical protein
VFSKNCRHRYYALEKVRVDAWYCLLEDLSSLEEEGRRGPGG